VKVLAGIAGILLGIFSLTYIGIYGSIIGASAGWLGSLGPGNATISNWAQMVSIISWLAPLLAIIGGIITFSSPRLGGIILGGSAFLLYYMLGLGAIGKLFVLPIGATAVLALISPSSASRPKSSYAAIKASTNSDGGSNDTTVSFDRAKWNALIQYDNDIAIVAAKLAPFGSKWVDEFASSFMALNDKTYLPQIEQKLLAAAKADAEEKEQQRIKAAEEQRAFLEEKERITKDRKDNMQFWIDQHGGKSRILLGCGLVAILLATIAIWHFASPDKKVISSNAFEPMQQSNHVNNSTTIPQGASSTGKPMSGTMRTMKLGTMNNDIVVKDFINNGVTIKLKPGSYILVGNAADLLNCSPNLKRCVAAPVDDFDVYYRSDQESFDIGLNKEPIGKARHHMEIFMSSTLGISKQQMCSLRYSVMVTGLGCKTCSASVNSQYEWKNLMFSFCPGATELPE
jgi:hypothetical protein